MKFLVCIFLIACSTLSAAQLLEEKFYAVQKSEEVQEISSRVSCETSFGIERVCAGVPQSPQKENSSAGQTVAIGQPREVSRTNTAEYAGGTKEKGASGEVRTGSPKELVRSLRNEVYQGKPASARSLPFHQKAVGFTTQQLQSGHRAFPRFTRAMYFGGGVSDQVEALALAIAQAEGYFQKGTIPNRLRNPGDLRVVRGYRFPGQVGTDRRGYAIFRNDRAGFAALTHQIDKIVAGDSAHYTVNMTVKELGRKYAESGVWARTVSRILGVEQGAYLWEVLDVPPKLCLTSPPSFDTIMTGAIA
jgi:hypothetical protein